MLNWAVYMLKWCVVMFITAWLGHYALEAMGIQDSLLARVGLMITAFAAAEIIVQREE